jgi:hypothetical protein
MLPIDVTFEVWTTLAEPVVGPETIIEGAPEWLSIETARRDEAPSDFGVPAWLDGQIDDDVLAELSKAVLLYRVRVTPPSRPQHDEHLQAAIQVAATIAEACEGWVLDPLAERVLDAEDMSGSCEPDIANHVGYTLFDTEARTLGMAKLGLPDLVIPSEDVDEALEHTLVGVLDAVASGLSGGVFREGEEFELAGCQWRLERQDDVLVALPVGVPLAEFLAELTIKESDLN